MQLDVWKVLQECNMITRMFLNIFGRGICVWIDKHDLIGMMNSYCWSDHPYNLQAICTTFSLQSYGVLLIAENDTELDNI